MINSIMLSLLSRLSKAHFKNGKTNDFKPDNREISKLSDDELYSNLERLSSAIANSTLRNDSDKNLVDLTTKQILSELSNLKKIDINVTELLDRNLDSVVKKLNADKKPRSKKSKVAINDSIKSAYEKISKGIKLKLDSEYEEFVQSSSSVINQKLKQTIDITDILIFDSNTILSSFKDSFGNIESEMLKFQDKLSKTIDKKKKKNKNTALVKQNLVSKKYKDTLNPFKKLAYALQMDFLGIESKFLEAKQIIENTNKHYKGVFDRFKHFLKNPKQSIKDKVSPILDNTLNHYKKVIKESYPFKVYEYFKNRNKPIEDEIDKDEGDKEVDDKGGLILEDLLFRRIWQNETLKHDVHFSNLGLNLFAPIFSNKLLENKSILDKLFNINTELSNALISKYDKPEVEVRQSFDKEKTEKDKPKINTSMVAIAGILGLMLLPIFLKSSKLKEKFKPILNLFDRNNPKIDDSIDVSGVDDLTMKKILHQDISDKAAELNKLSEETKKLLSENDNISEELKKSIYDSLSVIDNNTELLVKQANMLDKELSSINEELSDDGGVDVRSSDNKLKLPEVENEKEQKETENLSNSELGDPSSYESDLSNSLNRALGGSENAGLTDDDYDKFIKDVEDRVENIENKILNKESYANIYIKSTTNLNKIISDLESITNIDTKLEKLIDKMSSTIKMLNRDMIRILESSKIKIDNEDSNFILGDIQHRRLSNLFKNTNKIYDKIKNNTHTLVMDILNNNTFLNEKLENISNVNSQILNLIENEDTAFMFTDNVILVNKSEYSELIDVTKNIHEKLITPISEIRENYTANQVKNIINNFSGEIGENTTSPRT